VKFEVIQRDATARIGTLSIDSATIRTPAIAWYASLRHQPPSFAQLYLSQDENRPALHHAGSFYLPFQKSDLSIPPAFVYPAALPRQIHKVAAKWNCEQADDIAIVSSQELEYVSHHSTIYVMANTRELFANPSTFTDAITAVRSAIGPQSVLYTPGLGQPDELALLAYCTVDLVDSLSLIEEARRCHYLSLQGSVHIDKLAERPCSCPACLNDDDSFAWLCLHNYYTAETEMRAVRNAISQGVLRSMVEVRAAANPHHATILRLLDRRYPSFQEERYPVTGGFIRASSATLTRPDIDRFRKRVLHRYSKPPSARILLLLPCSARKPYSFSRSHRLFRKAIQHSGNPGIIHEVMVTSPLGLVPRELELIYPAAHYDISVTGIWSIDEQVMLQSMLKTYLDSNHYDLIIQHLPPEIAAFLDLDAVTTCTTHPTESTSLKALSSILTKETAAYEHVSLQMSRLQTIRGVLLYQFGDADTFLTGSTVKGRYPGYKILSNTGQLGMLVEERGFISLTLEGGKYLATMGKYQVVIDDFIPKGSVFAVGVRDADPAIRTGDDVVVMHCDKVRAVGVARMSGAEMIESTRGAAVATRHHI